MVAYPISGPLHFRQRAFVLLRHQGCPDILHFDLHGTHVAGTWFPNNFGYLAEISFSQALALFNSDFSDVERFNSEESERPAVSALGDFGKCPIVAGT